MRGARALTLTGDSAGGVFELLAPEATWTIVGSSPMSRTYAPRDEFLALVMAPFNARLGSPLVPTVNALYADGDVVVAYFDTIESTALWSRVSPG